MKRWLKRVGLTLGALVLVVASFLLVEHVRGRVALTRRLNGLKAGSEKLRIAELLPRRPPDDQNAYLALVALTNELEEIGTNLDNLPPLNRFTAPGQAIVSWRLAQWVYDRDTNNWTNLTRTVLSNRALLSSIQAASEKPGYDGRFDYQNGFVDFRIGPLVPIRQAAQLLEAGVLVELNQGRNDEAFANLVTLVKLAAGQTPEPLVICQLVRTACAEIAFATTWQALQAPGWTEAQLQALQDAWQKPAFERDMGSALEMERALTLDFCRQIRKSREKVSNAIASMAETVQLTGGTFDSVVTWKPMLEWIYVPVWRFTWADQDEVRLLNRWQDVIEKQRVAYTNSWSSVPGRSSGSDSSEMPLDAWSGDTRWIDRVRFPFSSGPFGISVNTIRRSCYLQTEQQMVVTAIAIERYRLQFGALPSNLEALVPRFLAVLPTDRMDGKTLRYRTTPQNAGFVLYSVGEDGMDDGGDPSLRPGKEHFGQMWDGKDAVWPSPASAKEASEDMMRSLK